MIQQPKKQKPGKMKQDKRVSKKKKTVIIILEVNIAWSIAFKLLVFMYIQVNLIFNQLRLESRYLLACNEAEVGMGSEETW